jgi:hypothetical protein
MQELFPDIDSDVPLPASATEAMPQLSDREELEMRARTIKLISDLTGKPIEVDEKDRGKALEAAQKMLSNQSIAPQLATYSNPTVAYLAGLVAQHDTLVVKELADLKKYVVNKLIAETDHPEAKIRLTALRALGEIDGVDAFKKRSEVTMKQQSVEEIEKELLATLEKLEKRTIDVSARVIPADVVDVEPQSDADHA